MPVVEMSGKTVDEAVAKALAQLALSRDQVDVDVVSEGKRGVFGIGAEDAVVRVTSRATAAAPPPRAPRPRPARR
ncbi:MAG: protein jag, partial [Chloroflexi bacterium]|nr:protein jag [Chloroflexota bacterium]